MSGSMFSAPPKINHVAMSLAPDALDADGRKAIVDFHADVFGFNEYEMMTEDRKLLVLGFHSHEQFLFLIAEDEPMRSPRLDHWGFSVATKADFDGVAERCAAWRDRLPDEVDHIEPSVEEHAGMLRIHSLYVRYRLPLMAECQWWEWL
jgi:hypothetical protein